MDFADKAGIMATLWLEFKEDEDFSAFVDYNDIGLPLAYCQANGLVKETTPLGEQYILETTNMFFDLLEITEAEVDELEDQSLTAILLFGYNKKNPGKTLPE
jgi:hypothetical protein